MLRIAIALLIALFSRNLTAQESRPESPAVATIDGHPVTRDELIRHLLELHESAVVEALIVEAVLDLELEKAGFKRSESDAGWDDLQQLQEDANPESLPSWPKTPDARRQRFIEGKVALYDVSRRGAEPPPPAGLVAEVRQRDGTASRQITPDQAVARLIESFDLRESVAALVDRLLIDRELARAGKSLSEAELDAWEASVRAKYQKPFDWTMICKFKKTTPQRERARWRTVEAWKRLTGWRLDEKELETFHQQNKDRISGLRSAGTQTQPVMNRDLSDPEYRRWVVEELEQKHLGLWLTALRAKSRIWIAPSDELARILKAK